MLQAKEFAIDAVIGSFFCIDCALADGQLTVTEQLIQQEVLPQRSTRYPLMRRDESLSRKRVSFSIILAALLCGVGVCHGQQSIAQHFRSEHSMLAEEFESHLTQLARECLSKNLLGVAEVVQRQNVRPLFMKPSYRRIRAAVAKETVAENASPESQLIGKMRAYEKEYAEKLCTLAKQLTASGMYSYGAIIFREALNHDPEHKSARTALGYVERDGRWLRLSGAYLHDRGKRWSDRFGWVSQSDLLHISNGEIKIRGRWIDENTISDSTRTFDDPWIIRTDHFCIKTDAALDRGMELGLLLEDCREVLDILLGGALTIQHGMPASKTMRSEIHFKYSIPCIVYYYRTIDEYRSNSTFNVGNDNYSSIYMQSSRILHCYAATAAADAYEIVLHEATRQLLHENGAANRILGERSNYWAIAGVASYMESLTSDAEILVVGQSDHARFATAGKLANLGATIPIRRLVSKGRAAFNESEAATDHYSQAAGMVRFFLDYDEGRYREQFATHVLQICNSTSAQGTDVATLDVLTGKSYELLHVEYEDSFAKGNAGPQRH
ncbi:MAG: hypothetical protein JWP89_2001 [Schlesneria sp.]|nr:hypothetical protein [Schlesneria sp.]